MNKTKDILRCRFTGLLLVGIFLSLAWNNNSIEAQNPLKSKVKEVRNDAIPSALPQDSLAVQDSTVVDTVSIALKFAKDTIDAPINYQAQDSIIYDIKQQKIFLYGGANLKQNPIELTADRVEINYPERTLYANGVKDTLGKLDGKPVFSDGKQSFESDQMAYNFDTKKGKISQIVTEEGDGYLRGNQVKISDNNEMFAQDAFYTTCNRPHPHFKIEVDKVKVIPNELIVSGPAQLVVEDIPTPLILPFAIFPLFKGRSSGVVLPSYGYSPNQGYYLRGGGYYFGINDHLDAELKGDLFSNGSWRLGGSTRYRKRYKYNGGFNLEYGITNTGDPITTAFSKRNNFAVRWNHSQDGKARPNSSFSSNVNFSSRGFNQEYRVTNNSVLTNTVSSGINYSNNLVGTPFSLSVSARGDQNLNTGAVNITMPSFAVNMQRQFPFKRKIQVGSQKWYEKVGLTYSMNGKVSSSTIDTLLFTPEFWEDIDYGTQHRAAMSTNFRILNYINVSPSVNYSEVWYLNSLRKQYQADTTYTFDDFGEVEGFLTPGIDETQVNGFEAARQFNTSLSFTTKLFGMFNFNPDGKIKALRHELTPGLSFNYRPDFSDPVWGNYFLPEAIDGNGNSIATPDDLLVWKGDTIDLNNYQYSIFEDGIYGGPGRGEQGNISFSLGNNLQMKIASKDTSKEDGIEKLKLLDRLNFSTSYNMAADSFNLSNINFSGGTTLFEKLRLNFSGAFDPYAIDDNGSRINQWQWEDNRSLARLTRTNVNFSTSFSSKKSNANRSTPSTGVGSTRGGLLGQSEADGLGFGDAADTDPEREEIVNNPSAFVDWNLPWRFNVDYTMSLNRTRSNGIEVNNFNQTLNLGGEVNLTPEWRMRVNSGYDFTNKGLARTTLNVYRNLHCWEMSFLAVPFGSYRRFEFTLRAKSAMLQDLKLSRRRYWQDL